MILLLAAIAIGILIGIITGLIPGIHPNMIILAVPLLMVFGFEPLLILVFLVAMGISNSIADVIPSILIGASDAGNELAILPGHKLLLDGLGYHAIKLTVIGSMFSVILCILLAPLLILIIPPFYGAIKPVIYSVLIFIVAYMIISEPGNKKIFAFFSFTIAGIIGLLSVRMPISSDVVLFPIFSGFFGVSMLMLQIKSRITVPKQSLNDIYVSKKTMNRSVVLGSIGGILSGFMPGVGSSQVATIFSVDKNENSFLMTMGAITTANIIISILSLWLIGKARSGVAIAIGEITSIGLGEVMIIIFTALVVTGVSTVVTLKLAKKFIKTIEKINYNKISVFVVIMISLMTFYFTGLYGLFLLVVCTSLGIFTSMIGIKRGNLMGVLILPIILFYIGI